MDEERLAGIINQLLQNRPDLTRDTILAYIAEKKARIGSGFLTDIGAAYLVAADLGIDLSRIERRIYHLSEIQPGMSNIMVKCYFLCISRRGDFIRSDGTKGSYVIFLVFDQENITKAVAWDINILDKLKNIDPGTSIVLNNANVRAGKNGVTEVHMNTGSQIETLHNEKTASIDPITQTPSQIKNIQLPTVIKGIVDSPIKETSFLRKDGTQGNAIQFLIRDENTNSKFRVIIWNPFDAIKATLNSGDYIRLINVQPKPGRGNSTEFHGSATTIIQKLQKESLTEEINSFIVISIGHKTDDNGRRTALLYDGKAAYTWTTSGKYSFIMDTINIGDELYIRDYTFVNNQMIIIQPEKNISIIRNNTPALSKLYTRISDSIKSNIPIILEVVALSKTRTRDITLKNGKIVTLRELSVGDTSGQAELIAWGNVGDQISEILPGRRLLLYGVVGKLSPQKDINLELKEFSFVKKISD